MSDYLTKCVRTSEEPPTYVDKKIQGENMNVNLPSRNNNMNRMNNKQVSNSANNNATNKHQSNISNN